MEEKAMFCITGTRIVT